MLKVKKGKVAKKRRNRKNTKSYYWFYLSCWHLSLILWDRSLSFNTTPGAAWMNTSLFIVVTADDLHTCGNDWRCLHLAVSTAVTTGSSQLLHSSPHSEHPCWVSVAAREALTEVCFLHDLLIPESSQAFGNEAKNCFHYHQQERDPLSACPPQTMSCKSGDCSCQESTLLANLYPVLERRVMFLETVLGQTAVAWQVLFGEEEDRATTLGCSNVQLWLVKSGYQRNNCGDGCTCIYLCWHKQYYRASFLKMWVEVNAGQGRPGVTSNIICFILDVVDI